MNPNTTVAETNFLIRHMRKKGIKPGSAIIICIGAAMTIAYNSAKDATTALAAIDEAEKTAQQMAARLRRGITDSLCAAQEDAASPAQT